MYGVFVDKETRWQWRGGGETIVGERKENVVMRRRIKKAITSLLSKGNSMSPKTCRIRLIMYYEMCGIYHKQLREYMISSPERKTENSMQ